METCRSWNRRRRGGEAALSVGDEVVGDEANRRAARIRVGTPAGRAFVLAEVRRLADKKRDTRGRP